MLLSTQKAERLKTTSFWGIQYERFSFLKEIVLSRQSITKNWPKCRCFHSLNYILFALSNFVPDCNNKNTMSAHIIFIIITQDSLVLSTLDLSAMRCIILNGLCKEISKHWQTEFKKKFKCLTLVCMAAPPRWASSLWDERSYIQELARWGSWRTCLKTLNASTVSESCSCVRVMIIKWIISLDVYTHYGNAVMVCPIPNPPFMTSTIFWEFYFIFTVHNK